MQYNQWMKEVNGDNLVSKLSIPGTHNSAACHNALPSVQCQDKNISDQLNNGVRFLDVRLSRNLSSDITTTITNALPTSLFGNIKIPQNNKQNKNDDLVVIHGKFPVKLGGNVRFDEVLNQTYKFLDSNPSETVILSLKQEGQGEWNNDNDEFPKVIYNRYINKNNGSFKKYWYLNNSIPKLNDCRGKIILLRRFGLRNNEFKQKIGGDNNLGINASFWSYNTIDDNRDKVRVQDFCEIKEVKSIGTKINYIKDHCKRSAEYQRSDSNPPKLFLNFCSASNFFNQDLWPNKINDILVKNNLSESFSKGNGVVILDYVGKNNWKYVKELVNKNF
ncbi:phosphatidylinositol-specific phospholipase C [Ascoidea rubescens DSM 1968]|uniref:PLC-like phosphodiesterase n=1 Tax=Ascoidea rubescens DSM 1968 TaxID=1344418 RepID=A0A1D2VSK7_9ASCO|nr:PLC-like phosphodiesterase [Ascoidea rubescens DSM 1968]ODV64568.1 PLC-like phosphodiesterase [Ascoidea rubescens DSM 1968]